MHITCVICSDLISGWDDTFVTNCGHLFHYNCVIQWFERSKTCPQCRATTSEENIHRVYFNVANSDGSDDPISLQNKIEGLKFKLKMKDVDLKNAKEKQSEQLAKNEGLRNEVVILEVKLASAYSELITVKERVNHMKSENRRMNDLDEENRRLKDRFQALYGLETIRSGSTTEVDDMLETLVDSSSESSLLAIYCSVLKRELQEMKKERKISQSRVTEFSQDLSKAYAERDLLKEKLRDKEKEGLQLTEQLYVANAENESLEKTLKERGRVIQDLQQSDGQTAAMTVLNKLTSGSPSKENAATKILLLLAESPAPEELLNRFQRAAKSPVLPDLREGTVTRKTNLKNEKCLTPELLPNMKRKVPAPTGPQLSDPILEYDMPKRAKEMPSTSRSRPPSHQRGLSSKADFSTFQKSRLCTQPEESLNKVLREEVHYDGMGGHRKQDNLPDPRRQTFTRAKPKIKRHYNLRSKATPFTNVNYFKSP